MDSEHALIVSPLIREMAPAPAQVPLDGAAERPSTGSFNASPVALENTVRFARQHLYRLFGQENDDDRTAWDIPSDAFPRVNVTLRVHGQVRGSMSANGSTLEEQLRNAVEKASLDRRFTGAVVAAELPAVSVEVWLQIASEPIPLDERTSASAIRMGFDGVEVRQGSRFAYYKPSVALTNGFSTPQEMFDQICRKAALPADSWRSESCDLTRTSWIHLSESGPAVLRMAALRPLSFPTLAAVTMVEWAEAALGYLTRNQQTDGSFCYLYHPLLNTAIREKASSVRAAGCASALALAACSPHLPSAPLLDAAARRAVLPTLRRAVRLDSGGCYIADEREGACDEESPGNLGTTALVTIALLCHPYSETHRAQLEELITGLKSAQRRDGLFECLYGKPDSTHTDINFYPGEALLALVKKAATGDESCRPYYRGAFEPYRRHFRNAPAAAFVGWHADVWSRAARLDGSSEYADFVFEQTDWLLQFQSSDDGLTFGGFVPPGELAANSSSIVYAEAVARAASLALAAGDRRWRRYRDAVNAGLVFCSRLRLVPDQSPFFPDRGRALGGVTRSLSNFRVRSDKVQHLITLCLAILDEPELLS